MADEEQVVDAEVVPDDAPAAPHHGAALARRPTTEVIAPLDTAATKQAMQQYQEGLRQILAPGDWQNAGRGERFVKKSGWRKIAAWFGLSIELVRDDIDRDDDGSIARATVWARAVAPNSRYADGDGHCDVKESRFSGPRGNKAKLENDLRATATTRAVNRAISNLVGMGAVSAEEVEGTAHGPAYGPAATDDLAARARNAVVYVLSADPDIAADDPRVRAAADSVLAGITEADGGYLPAVVADALRRVAFGLRGLIEPADGNATKEDSSGSSDSNADAAGTGDGAGDAGEGSAAAG